MSQDDVDLHARAKQLRELEDDEDEQRRQDRARNRASRLSQEESSKSELRTVRIASSEEVAPPARTGLMARWLSRSTPQEAAPQLATAPAAGQVQPNEEAAAQPITQEAQADDEVASDQRRSITRPLVASLLLLGALGVAGYSVLPWFTAKFRPTKPLPTVAAVSAAAPPASNTRPAELSPAAAVALAALPAAAPVSAAVNVVGLSSPTPTAPAPSVAPAVAASPAAGVNLAAEPVQKTSVVDELAAKRISALEARCQQLEEAVQGLTVQLVSVQAQRSSASSSRVARAPQRARTQLARQEVSTAHKPPQQVGEPTGVTWLGRDPVMPTAPALQQGRLLAVDNWGGRPSAVLSNEAPNGPRVIFLGEGDELAGVRIKRAEVMQQRVVLQAGEREATLTTQTRE